MTPRDDTADYLVTLRGRLNTRVRTNMAGALKKAVCIVTGGASGLGRATVQRLAQNGARVVIADLPESDGENVAKELGENCCFAPTDVSCVISF